MLKHFGPVWCSDGATTMYYVIAKNCVCTSANRIHVGSISMGPCYHSSYAAAEFDPRASGLNFKG